MKTRPPEPPIGRERTKDDNLPGKVPPIDTFNECVFCKFVLCATIGLVVVAIQDAIAEG